MPLNPLLVDLAIKVAEKQHEQPTRPPNLRLALGEVAVCASCSNFIPGQAQCKKYKWPVQPDQVCDSYRQKPLELPDAVPPAPGGGEVLPEQPSLVMTGMPQAPTAGPLKLATDGLDSIWPGVDQGPVTAAPLQKNTDSSQVGSPNPTQDEAASNQNRPLEEYTQEAEGNVAQNPRMAATLFSMMAKQSARNRIKLAADVDMGDMVCRDSGHLGRDFYGKDGKKLTWFNQASELALLEDLHQKYPRGRKSANVAKGLRTKLAGIVGGPYTCPHCGCTWHKTTCGHCGRKNKRTEDMTRATKSAAQVIQSPDSLYQHLFGHSTPGPAHTPKLVASPRTGDKLHDFLFSDRTPRPRQPGDLYQYLFGDKSMTPTRVEMRAMKTAGNMGLYSNASINPVNLKASPITPAPNAAQQVPIPQAKPLVGAQPGDPSIPHAPPMPAGPSGPRGTPNTETSMGGQAQPQQAPDPSQQQGVEQQDPTAWKPSPILSLYQGDPRLSTYSQFVPAAPPPEQQPKMASVSLPESLGSVAAKVAVASGIAPVKPSTPKVARPTPPSKPVVPRPKMPKSAGVLEARTGQVAEMLAVIAGHEIHQALKSLPWTVGERTKSAGNQVGEGRAVKAVATPMNQVEQNERDPDTIITIGSIPAADAIFNYAPVYTKRANPMVGSDAFDPLSIDMTIPADPTALLRKGGAGSVTAEQREMIHRAHGKHPGINGKSPGRSTGYLDPTTMREVRDATAGARTALDIGGMNMPKSFFDKDRFQTLAQMAAAGDTRAYGQMEEMTKSLDEQGLDPSTSRMARLRLKDLSLQNPQFNKTSACVTLGQTAASNKLLVKSAAVQLVHDLVHDATPQTPKVKLNKMIKSAQEPGKPRVVTTGVRGQGEARGAPSVPQPTANKGQQPVPVQPPANQVGSPALHAGNQGLKDAFGNMQTMAKQYGPQSEQYQGAYQKYQQAEQGMPGSYQSQLPALHGALSGSTAQLTDQMSAGRQSADTALRQAEGQYGKNSPEYQKAQKEMDRYNQYQQQVSSMGYDTPERANATRQFMTPQYQDVQAEQQEAAQQQQQGQAPKQQQPQRAGFDAQGAPDQAMLQKWKQTGAKIPFDRWAKSWDQTGQKAEQAKQQRQAKGYTSPQERYGMNPSQNAVAKSTVQPGAQQAQPTQMAGAGAAAPAQQMAGAGAARGAPGPRVLTSRQPQMPAQTQPMQNPTVGGQPVPGNMMGNQQNAMAMGAGVPGQQGQQPVPVQPPVGRGQGPRPQLGRTQGRQPSLVANRPSPQPTAPGAQTAANQPIHTPEPIYDQTQRMTTTVTDAQGAPQQPQPAPTTPPPAPQQTAGAPAPGAAKPPAPAPTTPPAQAAGGAKPPPAGNPGAGKGKAGDIGGGAATAAAKPSPGAQPGKTSGLNG